MSRFEIPSPSRAAPPAEPRTAWGLFLVVAVITAVLALLVLSCGAGASTPTRSRIFAFTPETAPSSAAIYLTQDPASTSDLLILELRAFEVVDLSSVVFDLEVPSDLLRFRGFSPGELLGNRVDYAAEGSGLIVGSAIASGSSVGNGKRRGFDGSGVIMRLELDAIASGAGTLRFTFSGAGDSRRGNLGLPFFAGTATIRR
jgi:hypothetical protein